MVCFSHQTLLTKADEIIRRGVSKNIHFYYISTSVVLLRKGL